MQNQKKAVSFPFPGKTIEESVRQFSKDWDYSIPLLLKPKDESNLLTSVQLVEIQTKQNLAMKILADGRIFSLNHNTSSTLFDNGYIIDISYLG